MRRPLDQPSAVRPGEPARPDAERVIVLSDLHMSLGRDATLGRWYPHEAFREDARLGRFVDVVGESERFAPVPDQTRPTVSRRR